MIQNTEQLPTEEPEETEEPKKTEVPITIQMIVGYLLKEINAGNVERYYDEIHYLIESAIQNSHKLNSQLTALLLGKSVCFKNYSKKTIDKSSEKASLVLNTQLATMFLRESTYLLNYCEQIMAIKDQVSAHKND